jgi:outer membrane PBP1 activator LpoA protein
MLVSLLCGCTNPANMAQPGSATHNKAQALNQAEKFKKLAGKEHTDKAVNYRLRAAEQLVAAGQYEQATQLMAQNNKRVLNSENTAYKNIILAQIALERRDPKTAQAQLAAIWTPLQLPEYLRVRFYTARSNAYLLSNEHSEAIQERVFLAKNLKTANEQRTNNAVIWDILNQTSTGTLQNMLKPNTRDTYNGWVSFALINKQFDSNPAQKMQALAEWKETYPDHPAIAFVQDSDFGNMPTTTNAPVQIAQQQTFVKSHKPYSGRSIDVPRKIALLLPLQGNHATAGQAVRDGFLAAYYAQPDNTNKPKVQVYDTTQFSHVADAYNAAVSEGAEFIVGPLIKEDVEALNKQVRPSIPVLALNSSEDGARDNVFQFGLSPEMEARAVADRAWREGNRNALLIAPKSAWGQRVQNAFTKRWNELGGIILGTQQIAAQANINKEVQQLLAIDASESRVRYLKSLGLKFNYVAHRRQDPDMIFIATNAALARQVKPLLNFYYAAKVPTYACSSVFNGRVNPSIDQDLNGIKFCDMPWLLDYSVRATKAYQAVASNYQRGEQTARLYALGLDAYRVAANIDRLTRLPDAGVTGMTGKLSLDEDQNVQRKLIWASFRKGIPYPDGDQL